MPALVPVEAVFNYPGMGQLFVDAISVRDVPVFKALVVVGGGAVIGATVLTRILNHAVDRGIQAKKMRWIW